MTDLALALCCLAAYFARRAAVDNSLHVVYPVAGFLATLAALICILTLKFWS